MGFLTEHGTYIDPEGGLYITGAVRAAEEPKKSQGEMEEDSPTKKMPQQGESSESEVVRPAT